MMRLRILLVGLTVAATQVAHAAESPPRREIIPGAMLMTHAERAQYRDRMQAATTPDERARTRARHLTEMQERARGRGLAVVDLAAQPPQPAPDRRKR